LNIYEDYVRVEGLQFNTQLDGVGASTGLRVQQSGEVRIASCIIKCTGTPDSGAVQGIRFDDGTGTLKIWNTLIYDWKKLNSTYDASITLGASGIVEQMEFLLSKIVSPKIVMMVSMAFLIVPPITISQTFLVMPLVLTQKLALFPLQTKPMTTFT